MLSDEVEGEVVAGEGDLDDDDAEGEQSAERVDGPPGGVYPAAVAVAANERRDRREDCGQQGKRERGAAEAIDLSPP